MFQLAAAIYIGFVSFGIPIYMVLLMVRRMRDYSTSTSERFVARRVADELKLEDRVAADAIRDVSTGREYSFLVIYILKAKAPTTRGSDYNQLKSTCCFF